MPNAPIEHLSGACARSAVAEVGWLRPDSSVGVAVLTPLVLDGCPAFALPYSSARLARAIGASTAVAVVLSDGRMAGRGWEPMAATGTVELLADPSGERYVQSLVAQELRKHPPARALADSALLRREHWWYLPRLIVCVTALDRLRPVGPRVGPDEAVLMSAAGEGSIEADTVAVEDWNADRLFLRSLGGRGPSGTVGAPAAVLAHDFSVPDRERDCAQVVRGRLTVDVLDVNAREGSRALPPPLGLLGRVQRQRRLGRACRAALRDATG